ncbi:MAG: hypothetical protein KatS3mg053_4024 [Candidatus Roseilinea sp.]|nr:MAG: hypothetical protein KatS3mg053_4024 [Candidatus Roseilinea sp.]
MSYKFEAGYSMSVRNFDNVFKSHKYETGEIKIEVVVFPDSAKPLAATSVISQVQHDAQQAGWTITELMDVSIAGTKGVRWIEQGERIPQGIVSYMFRDATQGRVYQIYAGPADSDYVQVFDQIALSFEVNAQSQ